ncbi:hypothetical protein FKM82_027099 [Ascaphus truei]
MAPGLCLTPVANRDPHSHLFALPILAKVTNLGHRLGPQRCVCSGSDSGNHLVRTKYRKSPGSGARMGSGCFHSWELPLSLVCVWAP